MTPELKKGMDEVAAMSSQGELAADLLAAGYNDQDIQSYLRPALQPTSWSAEQDRDRQGNAPNETLTEYKPTWRDSLRTNIETLGEKAGVPNPEGLAKDIAGDAFSMGLVDITPASIPLGIQEGVNQAAAGYRTGSKTDMALGTLNAGLNVAGAIPGAKAVIKGLDKVSEKLLRSYDPNVLGSNFGNAASATEGKVSNPLFKAEDWSKDPSVEMNRDLNFIASFYSPLQSTVAQMPIAKGGSTGQTILAYLQKRAPNVSPDELEFSGLKLDPNKRYTREDVNNLLRYSLSGTYANLGEVRPKNSTLTSKISGTKGSMRYSKIQPQIVTDKEEAYFEIMLEAERLPKQLVPGATTHHGEATLAHARGTINSAPDGKYIFVWELQSDPLQNIGKKYNPLENTGYGGPDAFGGLWVDEKLRDLVDFNETTAIPNTKLVNETVKKLFEPNMDKEKLVKFYKDNYNIDVSGRSLEALGRDAIRKTTDSIDEPFEDFMDEFFQEMQPKIAQYKTAEASLEKSELPFSTNTQYVKNLIVSLAARAKKDNITKIVIPPIEEIARQREKDFEGGFQAAVKALKPTYVNSVRKAINILNNETKGNIKVGTRNLQYKDLTQKSGVRNVTGVELDISNFNFNPEKERVRFAEGGMVEDEQMNRLMAEGGMTDDGMNIEPVTGNEIPPGSLAEEVRDDIDAKLSEGEYIVPADVVRFFGVRFFEDLRMQAKQGLSKMDADGRIGGTTVNANGVPMEEEDDEELSPEEEQMLMEALGTSGMAYGGVVKGMAEGGFTERNPAFGTKSFDRSTFSMPKSGGFESRVYYNPATKEKKTFQFMAGNPIGAIPAGFVPYTEGMENQAPVTPEVAPNTNEAIPTNTSSNSGGSGAPTPPTTGTGTGSGGINYEAWADKNKEAITANPYQFGLDALADTSGKMLSTGLGVAGALSANPVPLVGAVGVKSFNSVQNIAEAKAALQIMAAQGKDKTPEYASLEKQIEKATSDLPGVTEMFVRAKIFAAGNNYAKPILESLARSGPTTTPTRTPAKPGLAAPVTTSQATSGKASSSASDYIAGNVKASTGGPARYTPPTSSSSSSNSSKATPAQTQKSKDIAAGKTAAAGKSYASAGGYRSGRAEGGLVKKGAKAKSKGLASK